MFTLKNGGKPSARVGVEIACNGNQRELCAIIWKFEIVALLSFSINRELSIN